MPISFRTVGQACRGSGLARCAFCSVVHDLPDEFNETDFYRSQSETGSRMFTRLGAARYALSSRKLVLPNCYERFRIRSPISGKSSSRGFIVLSKAIRAGLRTGSLPSKWIGPV